MSFLDVRYSFDDPSQYGLKIEKGNVPIDSRKTRVKLLSDGIKITPELFPTLANVLTGLGQNMGLDRDIDCFVIAEPMMQAYCVPHSSNEGNAFTVVVSSMIIERLRPEEVRFVIGHEVGHYLCQHWRHPKYSEEASLGDRLAALSLSRSAEISADRIGMLATGSLEDACGAMIKVSAGLGAPHLQPDISSILSQYREISNNEGNANAIWSTHPIIPLRVRALMRFEPICRKLLKGESICGNELAELDKAIDADFHRVTGYALNKVNDEHLQSVRIWGLVYLFIADGVISKSEQEILSEVLGSDIAHKTLSFIKSQGTGSTDLVRSKLKNACSKAMNVSVNERNNLLREFQELIEMADILDGPIMKALEELKAMIGLRSL